MATEFTIPSINWGNTPNAIQNITLQYKLWSDPESAYQYIGTGIQVDPDGTILDSPLPTVTGLTAGNLYYVRGFNECDSPITDLFVISIQL